MNFREFQIWLQGVEQMQEQGWVPNASQWHVIRTKIQEVVDQMAKDTETFATLDDLDALAGRVSVLEAHNQRGIMPMPGGQYPRPMAVAQNSSSMDSGGQSFTPPSSQIPQNGQVDYNPSGFM